jgi:hypothetical protein
MKQTNRNNIINIITKINQKFIFPILLTVIFIFGCVTTKSIRYETIIRPPKPSDYPIEILDRENIKHPYKVIGIVQAEARRSHNIDDVIEHLKNEARKMGGDALIDLQHGVLKEDAISSYYGNPHYGSVYTYEFYRQIWSAKVIVWEQP